MKKWNKSGPPVLGKLPKPTRLDLDGFAKVVDENNLVVVDTREDRSAFMRAHSPRALYAPFDKTFPTVVGSYVKEDDSICLIVDEADLDEAVLNLIRIGRDNVEAYITPATLQQYLDKYKTMTTREIQFDDIEDSLDDDTVILDVRRASENASAALPGAINVAHTRLAARLDEIPSDKTLLVHCRSGARSAVASAMLERNGYDVVYVNGAFAQEPESTMA